jgi:membrane fusion protein (multidrug efflux system)
MNLYMQTTMKYSLLASVTVLFLTACGEKKAQQQGPPPPTAVTVIEVQAGDAAYYDEYPGTVVALNQTELRPQVTGYITGIYFKDGQKVVKGQKLYSIDQQLYSANYQQALANVQVQETNMLKAQRDVERYRQLDKQEAIAKQQVDYAESAYEAAKKQVDAAKAAANAVRANVGFATIYAPFSGTIGISQVRTGTSVVAGQTILNTVSSDNPVAVDFAVDQSEIFRFSQLQGGTVRKDSTFSLAFGKDVYPFTGSVSAIDRAVDPQTGTIKTRLSFPNEKSVLKPGMSTTVRVLSNSKEPSITIPYKAVTEQLGTYFAYVLGDSSKVSQRKLVLGRTVGANVIVREGLQAGEKIVLQGVQSLREGAMVKAAADTTYRK